MAKQDPMRRQRRLLSPEQKWEIFLEITTGELTQADAARKWGVDAGTVIRLRRDAKDACMTTFASSKPGRPLKARDEQLEALRAENARLTEAVKELAVELTRLPGEAKEGLLKLVDEAVDSGWAHHRACAILGVADVRVHRWRARLREWAPSWTGPPAAWPSTACSTGRWRPSWP